MEESGYVAEALLERLREGGVPYRVMGDANRFAESAPAEIDVALSPARMAEVPGLVARFAQDFDLRLVGLERPAWRSWRAVFAWSDELGRPRFMAARFFVGAQEGDAADARFICGLVDAVENQALGDERAAWLSELWREEPQESMERVRRFWHDEAQARLIAQAARHGSWRALRARLAELRRALRWLPRVPQPRRRRPRVLFTGREAPQRSNLMTHVQGRLAPLGLAVFEDRPGSPHGADFRVVFDGPAELDQPDATVVSPGQPLPAMLGQVEAAILRWLECRVERRYPDAVVGPNPLGARVLQTPGIGRLAGFFLNCRLDCRLRSPVLMPVPFGIVVDRGVRIGSRVTLMHQVTIGRKHVGRSAGAGVSGSGGNVPVIEDNVYIGAGAKVLGPVRIGRGATVGANAVVTRDVPSHCTVVGVNRILGVEGRAVAARRREEETTLS
jgi:acetyltransferase-like isoleucine patch superfamily enzyme